MIKLKDILLEAKSPDIFIPRRMEDRVERLIKNYIRNGNNGDLDLSNMKLTELPEILKNVDIKGDFFCSTNKLTSLEGSPKTVGGDFYCSNNKLTSLEGSSKTVGGDFFCCDNNLTSLVGSPSSVGMNFVCRNNNLTSLVGAPSSVGGNFFCRNNPIKFTEMQVRAVCDVKGEVYV